MNKDMEIIESYFDGTFVGDMVHLRISDLANFIRSFQPNQSIVVDLMAEAYEEERAKYVGGTVYYPNNQAAFRGAMEKALTPKESKAQEGK